MPVGIRLRLACIFLLGAAWVAGQTCNAGSGESCGVILGRLRFGVGNVVLCNMGRDGWRVGKVIQQHYREPSWPSGHVAPYMVEFDEGVGYVPEDSPRYIKQATDEDIGRIRKSELLLESMASEAERFKRKQLQAADALGDDIDLAAVLRYHAESCHVRPGLYANGGQMDWANQPDKFRRVLGAFTVDLPRSGPTVHVQSSFLTSLDSLGVLLHDAAGITAWKGQQQSKWSLRANPSSGALQPLEVYVFGIIGEEAAAQWHYNPYWHSLERVAKLPQARWQSLANQLPQGTLVVGLTSIVWRNAWKYGDPGFRYTHHDVGHQIASFAFAAAAQDGSVVLLDSITDVELGKLMRSDEPEDPVCLLAVFPSKAQVAPGEWWRLFRVGIGFWEGEPPPLHHGAPVQIYYGKSEAEARPIIAAARAASRRTEPPPASFWSGGAPLLHLHPSWPSGVALRSLIHKRRSAQSYNPENGPAKGLRRSFFFKLLRQTLQQPVWFPWRPAVVPFFFVHRVAGLEPGIYLMCRGRSKEELRAELDPQGRWLWHYATKAPSDVPLILLRKGDVREEAKLGSCTQDIASDSAFAVAFLAEHLPALERFGAWWYKRAHWEACAIGGALYLAAGAAGAGLQGTGIGCFFAPWVQAVLGVESPRWADVYHFTIGWPNEDRRVDLGLPPYDHADQRRGENRDHISSLGA